MWSCWRRRVADAVFVPSARRRCIFGDFRVAGDDPAAGTIGIDPGPMAELWRRSDAGAGGQDTFRGVCTVVAKLLNIVEPTHLLLGQKDYQQQAIYAQMLRRPEYAGWKWSPARRCAGPSGRWR